MTNREIMQGDAYRGLVHQAHRLHARQDLSFHTWPRVKNGVELAARIVANPNNSLQSRVDELPLRLAFAWRNAALSERYIDGEAAVHHASIAMAREAILLSDLEDAERIAMRVGDLITATENTYNRTSVAAKLIFRCVHDYMFIGDTKDFLQVADVRVSEARSFDTSTPLIELREDILQDMVAVKEAVERDGTFKTLTTITQNIDALKEKIAKKGR